MMTYLDTSVALAHLLGEGRRPDDSLWQRGLAQTHGDAIGEVFGWNVNFNDGNVNANNKNNNFYVRAVRGGS